MLVSTGMACLFMHGPLLLKQLEKYFLKVVNTFIFSECYSKTIDCQ
jgi:hypothetical protein